MNIAIVSYELLPQTGTSARTLGFVKALACRGHHVVLFGTSSKNTKESELVKSLGADYVGVNRLLIRPGPARTIMHAALLTRRLKSAASRFDIVHFVDYSLNLLTYPVIKKSLKAKTISDLHEQGSLRQLEPGLSIPLHKWAVFVMYEELALRFSDGIITPTAELAKILRLRYRKMIFPIPNCVEVQPIQHLDKRAHGHRDFCQVFFHANFHLNRSIREVQRVLEILHRVKKEGIAYRLMVAGPGSERLTQFSSEIVNLGYVDNPFDYLAKADFVVLPVLDSTLGIHSRLVEAMAAGKPVVASEQACYGLMPYLRDSGILVGHSLNEMANLVSSLLKHRNFDELGKRNWNLARKLFSHEVIGAALEDAYRRILNE